MTSTITSHSLVREGTLSALRALTSRGSAWPEPVLSVGRNIGKFGSKELCWEAVGPARAAFTRICPRIKEHLETGVETVSSWVTWSIYMIGRAPDSASPTILFCCEVSAHRKLVRNVVKESGILDLYPGIKTGHASRPPDFNQLVRVAEIESKLEPDVFIQGLAEQGTGACGMKLIIYPRSDEDPEDPHIRNATVGGVIQLADRFFYFTAEHAFSTTGEEEFRDSLSDTDNDSEFSIDEDVTDETADEGNLVECVEISKLDICDDANTSKITSTSEPCGLAPSTGHSIKQKQPISRRGVLQLSAVSISSRAHPATDLDYSLIEVADKYHAVPNLVDYGGKELMIRSIAPDGPKDVKILAVTSRGLIGGRLSGTPMHTSLPTMNTYQEVYCGFLDSPLEIGDCGSWVIDASTGYLYGHIIAGSPEMGAAMIVPASLTFKDIEARTQIRPELPGFPVPSYVSISDRQQAPETRKGESSRSKPLSQYDIAWTKSVTSQFVELIKLKHKASARKKRIESLISKEGSFKEDSMPPSYEQITKDQTSRERFKRRFLLIPEPPSEGDKEAENFRDLLIKLSDTPLAFEDTMALSEAFATLPLDTIFAKAAEKEAQYQKMSGSEVNFPWGFRDCCIIVMMNWFKSTFFTWVNNPPCSFCHSATIAQGLTNPTDEERLQGAVRVELYRCSNLECVRLERFPRYRNPLTLLRTRRGRVGEWAICFGLFCRALGAKVRWVWTAEDHAFIEFYSTRKRRWIHADPCENVIDQPRLYNEGWGKGITYVIAFSVEGATDVTRRYVHRVSAARDPVRTRCSEEVLLYILQQITARRRASLSDTDRAQLKKEDEREQKELNGYMVASLTEEFSLKWKLGSAEQSKIKEMALELAEPAVERAGREYS